MTSISSPAVARATVPRPLGRRQRPIPGPAHGVVEISLGKFAERVVALRPRRADSWPASCQTPCRAPRCRHRPAVSVVLDVAGNFFDRSSSRTGRKRGKRWSRSRCAVPLPVARGSMPRPTGLPRHGEAVIAAGSASVPLAMTATASRDLRGQLRQFQARTSRPFQSLILPLPVRNRRI